MKMNWIKYMIVAVLMVMATACDQSLEVYNHPADGLNFTDSLTNFSFVYGDPDATQEIMMVKVTTMGFVTDRERQLEFEQELTGSNDAIAGVHYRFEDKYVIPANANSAEIPVTLLRDKSLENQAVTLKIRVKSNGIFGIGLVDKTYAKIVFTDQLSKPFHWNGGSIYWFGVYGKVKHRWMIETTGEKWDDNYLYNVIGFNANSSTYRNENYDEGFVLYLIDLLTIKLEAYNQDLEANNQSRLTEEDGTEVSF